MGWDGRSSEYLLRMDFYPRDYFADRNVRAFTTSEEHGVYLILIFQGWIDGPLPADLDELKDLIPGGRDALDRVWPKVSRCFEMRDGLLHNRRQERERAEALRVVKAAREGGRIGNEKRWGKRSPSDRPPIAPRSHHASPPDRQHQQQHKSPRPPLTDRDAPGSAAGPERAASPARSDTTPPKRTRYGPSDVDVDHETAAWIAKYGPNGTHAGKRRAADGPTVRADGSGGTSGHPDNPDASNGPIPKAGG